MKDFLKAPFSNLLAIVLCLAIGAGVLTGSVSGGAQLAPLTLGGANPGFTNVTGLNVKDGSLTAPSVGFSSETTSGLYRVGANDAGWVVSGTKILDVSLSGVVVSSGTLTITGGVSRTVNIPLAAFIGCTGASAYSIPFSNGADTKPEYVNVTNQGYVLDFGVTTQVDTDRVCATVHIPTDYVSGGVFQVRATKSADTGATEIINCAISLNGAAPLAAGTILTVGAASALYTCTPTVTGVISESEVSAIFNITSGTTADNDVNFQSVGFEYTAAR